MTLTKGLSLNDCFWIGNENKTFAEVNLYKNPFSAEIAELAFTSSFDKAVNCASRSPEYASEGAMRKCWIKRCDAIFLMKADDWPNTGGHNQVMAEFFACQVAAAFGINHVQ